MILRGECSGSQARLKGGKMMSEEKQTGAANERGELQAEAGCGTALTKLQR